MQLISRQTNKHCHRILWRSIARKHTNPPATSSRFRSWPRNSIILNSGALRLLHTLIPLPITSFPTASFCRIPTHCNHHTTYPTRGRAAVLAARVRWCRLKAAAPTAGAAPAVAAPGPVPVRHQRGGRCRRLVTALGEEIKLLGQRQSWTVGINMYHRGGGSWSRRRRCWINRRRRGRKGLTLVLIEKLWDARARNLGVEGDFWSRFCLLARSAMRSKHEWLVQESGLIFYESDEINVVLSWNYNFQFGLISMIQKGLAVDHLEFSVTLGKYNMNK